MRKILFCLALIVLLCSGVAARGNAASGPGAAQADQITRIDAYIRSLLRAYQIPGLAVAIVKDNRIYMARAYGVKSLETREPLTTASIFHFASVSKPFSATAIMQLVEKGKMKLDDPLIQHLPYFKMDDPRYKEITIKQMLTHTAGIPDVRDYEWDKPQTDDGAAERYVRSLAKEKLIAAPGEKWQYSNMAFDILADVIAKVSGMSFEDYIKQHIFAPLGMVESDFLRARIKPELRISGHILNLKPQVSAVYPYNRAHAPSSCLNANVLDMSNWAIANMNRGERQGQRILPASSYALLFTPQFKISDTYAVGLSWFIDTYRGSQTISHGGGDLGFLSYLAMMPEKSLAVIVASNYTGTPIHDPVNAIFDIMLGFDAPKVMPPVRLALGQAIADQGVQKAIAYYRQLQKEQAAAYDFSERQLNDLGYTLINLRRQDDAIAIFKLNVEMFPASWNVYDSLAEAYMIAGQKDLASANYTKAVQLNPQNTNAVEQLKKLQGEFQK